MSAPAEARPSRPFEALLGGERHAGPPWLTRLRSRARGRFEAMGLPRPDDEDWRQTSMRPLEALAFERAQRATASPSEEADPLAEVSGLRATIRNGHADPGAAAPFAASLAAVLAREPEVVEPYLGAIAPWETHPFAALNLATFDDGLVVRIPEGVVVDAPILVHHAALPADRPTVVAPRVLILAGRGSSATVVETYAGPAGATTLTAAVTEIVLGDGARLDHVKVQAEPASAWHVASVAGRIGRDARLASHNVSWGAALARNDIGARLDGEGASCLLYGVYLAGGGQHVDNHTWLDHAKPHCPSWEMYKGVLAGRARAVFNGRIIVREGAQKTDAKQSNKNLLLSDGALVHTRPQLEIYANDVKCTHGATIGRLDETALFYLRTRGLGAAEARDLLVRAFVDDVLDKIPAPPVRAVLSRVLYERLAREIAG